MKYRLAVFDMDGTILNTLGDISASVNFALRAEHMPERTMAEIRGFVGNGVRRLIELSVPSDASPTTRSVIVSAPAYCGSISTSSFSFSRPSFVQARSAAVTATTIISIISLFKCSASFPVCILSFDGSGKAKVPDFSPHFLFCEMFRFS